MASTIPTKIVERIQFFETHLPIWAVTPANLGLTAAQVVDLSTRTGAARAAYEAAQTARSAAEGATTAQNDAVGDMYNLGADLVKTIRAYAETTANPGVYAEAQIPPPAAPVPTPPPATPTEVAVVVNAFGECIISWKASRAKGTQFILRRQLTPAGAAPGPWTFAGSTVTSEYTDTTVPGGQAAVSYAVIARRASGDSDPSALATLSFGTGGGQTSGAAGLGLAA